MKRKVTLVVGSCVKDTLSRRYDGCAKQLLRRCLTFMQDTMYTSEEKVVRAMMCLHRHGVIDLTIEYVRGPFDTVIIELDQKGDLINPWPDEFFSICFNLIFHDFDGENLW